MSVARSAFTVGTMTMASRIAGFARDWLMALSLGAGPAADAFFVAFKLPNFFRRLFAEGAFSAAFVPYFAAIQAQSPDAGAAFGQRVLSIFLPVLVLFVALMELFMPWVVLGLTGGFRDGDPDKLQLAIDLSRLTFPFLALISLVSLLSGILNGLGRFAAAAGTPVLLNLCLISAMLLAPQNPVAVAHWLAAAVSIAGLLQLVLLLHSLRKAGMAMPLRWPSLSPNVRAMLRAMAPAALGAGAVQINLLIDVLLATRYLPEGSISYLYYGDRLVQLPIGVIGVAVGTALLPALARSLSLKDKDGANRQMNLAIEMVLVITLPAMIALLTVPDIFIRILFEHGAFGPEDTRATVAALMAYSLGLPAYVLIKVFTPGFFARGDTRTPVRISISCLVLNTALGVALMQPLAHAGLALATAIAAWVNALSLWVLLVRKGQFVWQPGLGRRILGMLVAAGLMAGALLGATPFLEPWLIGSAAVALPVLLVLVGASAMLYLGLGMVTGAAKPARIRQAFRRRG